jgi:hypothetical protein
MGFVTLTAAITRSKNGTELVRGLATDLRLRSHVKRSKMAQLPSDEKCNRRINNANGEFPNAELRRLPVRMWRR